jgi:hypothetical protein
LNLPFLSRNSGNDVINIHSGFRATKRKFGMAIPVAEVIKISFQMLIPVPER